VSFVHLHAHSHYSFLDGASTVEELVDAALEHGMDALALTDTNGLYGAVRFWNAAKERGLRPIFGCELDLLDLGPPERSRRSQRSGEGSSEGGLRPTERSIVLLARDRQGWTSLCRIVSAAQLAGEKTKPRATLELVARHTDGLFALSASEDASTLVRLARAFGDSLYVELADHLGPDDAERCDRLAALARERGLAIVATNDVRYARPDGRRLHDVLRCIDLGTTLDHAGNELRANGEHWLKSEAALRERLGRFEDAFANAAEIAERCRLDLAQIGPGGDALMKGQGRLPGFPVPDGHTAFTFLYALCQDGAREKYGKITPPVSRQLAHELDVVDRCGLAEFFLINWDIVRFCKERRIPAQGRGSAADSIVAYVLDITKVDPIAHDLLFERFLTEDSRTMPDIDLDIATNDREEVIQYVYRKYGERYAAMVCNVVTYRARSSSREVAKALGFRPEIVDRMGRAIDVRAFRRNPSASGRAHRGDPHEMAEPQWKQAGWSSRRAAFSRGGADGGDVASVDGPPSEDDPAARDPASLRVADDLLSEMNALERSRVPLFREIVAAIADFPRHLSIHNGGMLITALPLVDTVPIERATMPGRNVVQLDKRDVEDLGLVKMDLLGLRTLSLIKDAIAMIEAEHGERLDLGTLPLDDPAVYDLLCEVDTIGVFQVESRAQAQALPRVRPRCFADIVVEVAIIRPGPLQGNMVNPYIRRRQGREPVVYPHPLLEPVLKETLGVILFQEQILRVAMAVAGFSPAAADKLRRAMSRARSAEDMERLRAPFVAGTGANGIAPEIANEIFRQIAAFAEFGFCKSHAAAFALTAYHTAHLKLYYPAEFVVALLNNQPMGFYSPAVIAGDAKRHGVRILPVDVNRSHAKTAIEEAEASSDLPDESRTVARYRACRRHHVRLGFRSVRGLGEAEADALVAERSRGGPFRSFDELARRVALKEEALRNLALVGGFDALGEPRRALLWRARDAHRSSPGYARPALSFPTIAAPLLPALSDREETALDYRITGVPTGRQVISYYREALDRRGVATSSGLAGMRHGAQVLVAGAVVVKQHPGTAKGHVFLSLEDERGMANIIIRPRTYAEFKTVLDTYDAVVVAGTLQSVDGVISVLARRLDPLQLFVPIAAREWQ